MTGGADPVLRVQRRILDQAGHPDVPVEAFGPFRDYDYGDWHTITDPDTRPDDPDCRPRPSLWTRIAGWFR